MPRRAWLEIDLDALAANLGLLRGLTPPGTLIEPVVKADAYGHGLVPVARALVAAGADGLCVAALDEALVLRAAGVGGRISVLYPVPPDGAGEAARRGIAVAVGDEEQLERLASQLFSAPDPLDLELEIETGLGRGGLAPERAAPAGRAIAAASGLRLAGVWSHLQAAEDRALTQAQVTRFEAALANLAAAGVAVPRRHLAASGGLLVGVPSYDAVRPGLAIYGLVPDELDPATLPVAGRRLRPVMSLRAQPVRLADLPPGHGVSYGPTFRTGRPSRIATLPLGYGDGWPRSLSNRAEALVRGVRAPIVGNVAMDAVMVDVTEIPGPPVGYDDEFTLLGGQGVDRITAAALAQSRTTNSWEIVTSMSGRLPRVYHASAGPLALRTLSTEEDRWLASSSGTATSATSRSTRS